MAIQWFPGHMHLTRKAIQERIKEIDVVIELLDARLPGSSANPMLAEITAGKPALKVLNKQDLADAERTAQWLAHYNAQTGILAIALDASLVTAKINLARLELRVLFEEILARYTAIDVTAPVEWTRSNRHTGIRHLWVALS